MALMNIRSISRFRLHRLTKYHQDGILFFVSHQEFPIFSVAAPIKVKAFLCPLFSCQKDTFVRKAIYSSAAISPRFSISKRGFLLLARFFFRKINRIELIFL